MSINIPSLTPLNKPNIISALADRPNLSAADMKAKFDEADGKLWEKVQELITILNNLDSSDINALSANNGAVGLDNLAQAVKNYFIPASQKGVANGVATLDENAKVSSVQLADDKLPATPDDGEYEVDVPVSFVSVPKSAPAPTSDAHLVNKEYADTKVAKVQGKELSTNDYTNSDKNKLASIEEGAQVNAAETDPTVPEWAKETNKPTYTPSEIGAVPVTRKINGIPLTSDVNLTVFSDVITDEDNALYNTTSLDDLDDGAYLFYGENYNGYIVFSFSDASDSPSDKAQFTFCKKTENDLGSIMLRVKRTGTWSNWTSLLTDYASKSYVQDQMIDVNDRVDALEPNAMRSLPATNIRYDSDSDRLNVTWCPLDSAFSQWLENNVCTLELHLYKRDIRTRKRGRQIESGTRHNYSLSRWVHPNSGAPASTASPAVRGKHWGTGANTDYLAGEWVITEYSVSATAGSANVQASDVRKCVYWRGTASHRFVGGGTGVRSSGALRKTKRSQLIDYRLAIKDEEGNIISSGCCNSTVKILLEETKNSLGTSLFSEPITVN